MSKLMQTNRVGGWNLKLYFVWVIVNISRYITRHYSVSFFKYYYFAFPLLTQPIIVFPDSLQVYLRYKITALMVVTSDKLYNMTVVLFLYHYGNRTRRFDTADTEIRHWTLSSASSIYSPILRTYFPKTDLNIILTSPSRSSKWMFNPTKHLNAFLVSPF